MKSKPNGGPIVADRRKPATERGVAVAQSQADEFPLHALPDPVLLFVFEAAQALGVDPSLIAGPCLATLAGCIGNRRRIVLKPGTWIEPAILWIGLVVRSGGKKTPVLNAVLQELHEREAKEIADAEARKEEYKRALDEWKSEPKGERGPAPAEPEPAKRLLVSDITTEGLLLLHANAPLGLLLHRDELGGWIRSYNQYKGGGQGADAQAWTEMHQGQPAIVDRKGSGTLSVPRAAVSIVGGIQPELLGSILEGEHLYNGVAARIIFIVPPETEKAWSDKIIDAEASEGWIRILGELVDLEPNEDGSPVDLPMTSEARQLYIKYFEDHGQREKKATGPILSALSKLEAATARLALVVQLAENPKSKEITSKAMSAGIEISVWFEGQAQEAYWAMKENETKKERRHLCRWIESRGGSTTKRDLARLGPSRLRDRAGEMLDDLVSRGRAKRQVQAGTRADKYTLCSGDDTGGDG